MSVVYGFINEPPPSEKVSTAVDVIEYSREYQTRAGLRGSQEI